MTAALARALMALAASCLGDRRSEWALAMQAEFEAARDDGKPLAFAWGCLAAALRELPMHEEGRVIIACQALAFLLIIPMAGLMLSSMLAEFPNAYFGQIEGHVSAEPIDRPNAVLSDGNRAGLPSLAGLLLVLAAAHLRIAWLVLERDWARIVPLATLLAAVTVTLAIFTAVVFAHFAFPMAQAAALAVELTAISALGRWHARSFGGSPRTFA